MYTAMVQHYGSQAQQVETFDRKYKAERFIKQQLAILEGYNKTYYKDLESWRVLEIGGDGTVLSTFWVKRIK